MLFSHYDAIFCMSIVQCMHSITNIYRNNVCKGKPTIHPTSLPLQNFSNLQISSDGIGRDKEDSICMCVFPIPSFALFWTLVLFHQAFLHYFALFWILLLFPRAFQSVKLPLQGSVHHMKQYPHLGMSSFKINFFQLSFEKQYPKKCLGIYFGKFPGKSQEAISSASCEYQDSIYMFPLGVEIFSSSLCN